MPSRPASLQLGTAVLLAAALLCALNGCRRASAGTNDACLALEEGRKDLDAKIARLEKLPAAVPTDAVRYAAQTEQELVQFADLFAEIHQDMDALHDAWEVPCKWPLIEADDFHAAFDLVYAPHIALVAREIAATQAMAERLESGGPTEVVGEVVAGYRFLAERMAVGLQAQVAVCESDFDSERCEAYRQALRDALTGAIAPSPRPPSLDTASPEPAPALQERPQEETPP